MKKRSFQRPIAALLSAGLLLSLTACSSSTSSSPTPTPPQNTSGTDGDGSVEDLYYNKEGYPISDEVITLTLSGPTGSTPNWNDTIMFEEYEKRLGIKLDATTYSNDEWATQFTLMLSSDSLPDLLGNCTLSPSDVLTYGGQGYFLDFTKYYDLMPALMETYEQYPEYKTFLTSPQGSVYGFSLLSDWIDSSLLVPQTYMSKTWLKNVGKEAPTTLDELYDVLLAFKTQDANGNGDKDDEIPMGMAGEASWQSELPILWAFGINGYDFTYNLTTTDSGAVVLGETTDNYKAFLKYMHKLYSEGLINKDAYVLTSDELQEKVLNCQVGYFGNYVMSTKAGNQDEMDWYYVTGFTDKNYNTQQIAVMNNRVSSNYRALASATTKYPEAVARFIDYMYTDEGVLSQLNGYEGVTFDYRDVNGIGVIDHTNYAKDYASTDEYRAKKAIALNSFSLKRINQGTIYNLLKQTPTEELTNTKGEVWELCTGNALREYALRSGEVKTAHRFPTIAYTSEEASRRSTLLADVKTYLTAAKAQFIIGEVDIDSGWSTFLSELNSMGLSDLLAIEQAAYDRYSGK